MSTEKDFYDLTVSVLLLFDFLIDTNENWIIKETFEEELFDEIHQVFMGSIHEEIIVSICMTFGFGYLYPRRSYPETETFMTTSTTTTHFIEKQLYILCNSLQHEQRSPEWYEYRHGLVTASNAYKMFGSQRQQDSLIYEKCQPIKIFSSQVSEFSPLHHGQKYEPVSIALYEKKYDTTVGEFGCIQHSTLPFLGASPDGINTQRDHCLYGRMLEIKNVVSREITGIPKLEYWVQMQLQMETCNLEETDFLETKFVEYADESAFLKDTCGTANPFLDNKGVLLQFVDDGRYSYKYMPLDVQNYETFLMWREDMLLQRGVGTFTKTIFWKLEVFSCVLVPRNKQWFESNIPRMTAFWEIVKREKTEGCEHRAPNKKPKSTLLTEIQF
jgi:putative phage-type endonuclease